MNVDIPSAVSGIAIVNIDVNVIIRIDQIHAPILSCISLDKENVLVSLLKKYLLERQRV